MRAAFLAYYAVQHALRTIPVPRDTGGSKLARGLAGRRDAHRRLAAWGRESRDAARACVWLHAPSVGEGLQARAVLHALRERRSTLQSAFTHFSPSAEALAGRFPADVAAYLPWDLPGPAEMAIEGVAPDVLAFTSTEVWPVLTGRARARGTAVALVAATLRPGARRLRRPARRLLRATWSELELVATVAPDDAERFASLGVAPEALHVTGDPRVDDARVRVAAADPDAPFLAPFRADPRPTLVAGSTWPSDLRVLLPALDRVRDARPELRAIVAPHEPEPARVRRLLAELRRRGWRAATLAWVEEAGASGVDAVVVERVGVLQELYTVGSVAYVGGGFRPAGLHSVLEPAAAGVPVAFGPGRRNAARAEELAGRGGAARAPDGGALARILLTWFADEDGRGRAAGAALDSIEAHRGAAGRTAALLEGRFP